MDGARKRSISLRSASLSVMGEGIGLTSGIFIAPWSEGGWNDASSCFTASFTRSYEDAGEGGTGFGIPGPGWDDFSTAG